MSNKTVKVSWGGQTRRFVLHSTTVEALTSSLASKFADMQGKPFDICYKDEAGDVITIKETDELVAALSMSSTDLQLIIQLLPVPTSSAPTSSAPTSSAFDGVVASAVRVPPPAVSAAGAGAGAGASKTGATAGATAAARAPSAARAPPAVPAARGRCEVIDAKHISEPCVSTVVMKPNEEFTYVCKMTNTGSVAWPYGTYPSPMEVDPVFSVKRVNVPQAAPGETVLVSVTIKTPTLEGRHVGYWRLAKPDGERFGHRFWLDIIVTGGAVSGDAVSGGAVSGDAVSGGAVSSGAGSGGVMLGGAVSGGGAGSSGAVSAGAVSGGGAGSSGSSGAVSAGASGATVVMTDAQVDEALAAMHQMGLTDDTLNLQALVATGGDLPAALNYMFST